MSINEWVARRLVNVAGALSPSSLAEIRGQKSYGMSDSGKQVDVDSSLALSAVWACVRLLSETISTLPIQIFERGKDGKRALKYDHPLYQILHDTPNADMSAVDFWCVMQAAVELQGNAFALKLRAGKDIIGLDPLKSEGMKVTRDKSGALVYEYKDKHRENKFTEDDILHIRGFTLDGVMGMSTIAYAKSAIGLALAADGVANDTFRSGLRPAGILTVQKPMSREQREAYYERMEAWKAKRTGSVMVLEMGETLTDAKLSPEDAQLLASRAFSVADVCRWFGVPPYLIGHTEKSTSWGTGLEQQNIGFLTYTLAPRLSRIAQAVGRCLIPIEDRQRYFAEFNIEGLLRADSSARAAFYSQMTQNGVMTRNEVRSKENLQPLDGGDELTIQSNMMAIGKLGQGETQ
ncbi:MAG: phage portal protein [Burkholderiales bacterium]|jgi:HK97 family phage portal protein|nr:phage portal protein [Burkholderiales bacterium]